jgi:catechol 2,3-dioxygenase-like lactoylglutathione lyase family enzyme
MPLGHVSLATGPKHFDTMKAFYVAALAPLGYSLFMEHAGVVGFRQPRGAPEVWLHAGTTDFEIFDGNLEKRGGKTHIAFEAKSQAEVQKWYQAAMYVFQS